MSLTIYDDVFFLINDSLKKKEVSDELIECFKTLLEKTKEINARVMELRDQIYALKMFSAVKTCEEILSNSIPQLEKAKKIHDNPTVLDRLGFVLLDVTGLLQMTDDAIQNKVDHKSSLRNIRACTFRLQEISEEIGLIPRIEVKLNDIPAEIRKSFFNHVTSPE